MKAVKVYHQIYVMPADDQMLEIPSGASHSWSVMSGYGLLLNYKHKSKFNEMLLEYRENRDLDRFGR